MPGIPIVDEESLKRLRELVARLSRESADRLGLSVGTVKDHVHNVLDKTGLSNRAAVAAAMSGATR